MNKVNSLKTAESKASDAPEIAEKGTQGKIFDTLKKRLELETDQQLAEFIGVKKSFLSELRSGKRELPAVTKLKILDKIGYLAARDTMLALTPSGFAAKIKALGNARMTVDLSKFDDSPNEAKDTAAKEFMDAVEKAAPILGPELIKSIVSTKLIELRTKNKK
jgi:transcriptional regulator with XRE-family HTH domain